MTAGLFDDGTFDAGYFDGIGSPSSSVLPDLPHLPEYRWQVMVRQPDRTLAGYVQFSRLEMQVRHLGVSRGIIDIIESDLSDLLTVENAGIVIAVNGRTWLSGPVVAWRKERSGDTRTLEVTFADDLALIADRVVSPEPWNATPPYNTNAYDVRTAAAETVIKQWVTLNAGPDAIPARQVEGLTVAEDLGRGSVVRARGRWQPLLDAIVDLAARGQVGFRTTTDGLSMTFDCYVPADKTRRVIFAVELRNIEAYNYAAARPTANYVYAGGQGEGTARNIREGANAESVTAWGRIETFADRRDVDNDTELDDAITAVLRENAATYAFSADLIDTGAHQWAPIATSPQAETYDLGDRVTVKVDGHSFADVIREIAITVEGDLTTIRPIVGTSENTTSAKRFVTALVREVRDLQRQLRDLQRN